MARPDRPPLDPPGEGPDPTPVARPLADRYGAFTPVGQGGMGIVYRVRDRWLARDVALKVVRPDGGSGRSGITPPFPLAMRAESDVAADAIEAANARFLNEACLAGSIEHPSIPPVYDVGQTAGGLPYYTMRFVRGGRTLADAIEVAAKRDIASRLTLLEPFLKVCDAVAYAHARGVVHRDLKPENVALGDYGEAMLIDWGLATAHAAVVDPRDAGPRSSDEAPSAPPAEAGSQVLGTPGWLAPEAAAGRPAEINERSDVFSLGVILFQILTGRLPWPCRTAREYLEGLAASDAPAAVDVDGSIPDTLSLVCGRALRRASAERLVSAAALAAAVRAWHAESEQDRERRSLVTEAQAALEHAESLPPDTALPLIDRAVAACATLRARGGEAMAAAISSRIVVLRERAITLRERVARRRALRRAGAIALALAVVATAGVAIALDVQRREAEIARSDAEKAKGMARVERARAEDEMRFMLFDLRERLEAVGRLDLLAAVAERAQAHYATASASEASPDEDLSRAVALRVVGEVFQARGNLPRALASFQAAADVAGRAAAAPSASMEVKLEAAIDRARVGEVFDAQGDRATGLSIFEDHLRDLDRLANAAPTDRRVRTQRARAQLLVGHALVRQNDVAHALAAVRRAKDLADALLTGSAGDEAAEDLAIEIRLDEAQYLDWSGDANAAVDVARAALTRTRHLESDDPTDLRWRRRTADAYLRLIVPLARTGDVEGAVASYRDAERILEHESAADPADERWSERRVVLAVRISDALVRAGRHAEALEILSPAVERAETLVKRDPSSGQRLHLVVDATDRTSAVLAALNDAVGSLGARRRNVEASEALAARDPGNTVWRMILGLNRVRLGEALAAGSDHESARDTYEAAAKVLAPLASRFPDDDDLQTASAGALVGGGRARALAGDHAGGVDEARRGVGLFVAAVARAKPGGELPFRLGQARFVLAGLLDPGDPTERREALAVLGELLAWARSVPRPPASGPNSLLEAAEALERLLKAR